MTTNNGVAADVAAVPLTGFHRMLRLSVPTVRKSILSRLWGLRTPLARSVYPERALELGGRMWDNAKWKAVVVRAYLSPSIGIHRVVNNTGTTIFIMKIDGEVHTLEHGMVWSTVEKVVEPAHAGRIPVIELRYTDKFPAHRIEIHTQIYKEGDLRIRQDTIILVDTVDAISADSAKHQFVNELGM